MKKKKPNNKKKMMIEKLFESAIYGRKYYAYQSSALDYGWKVTWYMIKKYTAKAQHSISFQWKQFDFGYLIYNGRVLQGSWEEHKKIRNHQIDRFCLLFFAFFRLFSLSSHSHEQDYK